MSDLDRYLTDEVEEKAAEIIHDALDNHGHNGIDCRPDAGMDLYVTAATRVALSAVLPDIIRQAKAEALDERAVKMAETSIHTSHVTGQALSRCVDLVEHITKVEVIREAKAEALRDAADELRRLDDGRTGGYYDAGRHIIRRLDARADQIEQGGQP